MGFMQYLVNSLALNKVDKDVCEECGGKGTVEVQNAPDDFEIKDCPVCGGEADFSGATTQER